MATMDNDIKYTGFLFWSNDVDTFIELTDTFEEYELYLYYRMDNDIKN